jgi:catechol 2,3-dioxygenase-like lactoylglutathione lyase family enzyme
MKRFAFAFAILACCVAASAQDKPKRPSIFGIASVRVLVRSVPEAQEFYSKLFGKDHPCVWCGQQQRNTFSVNRVQFVELAKSAASPSNRIDEVVFATDDVSALKKYFAAHDVPTVSSTYWALPDSGLLQPTMPAVERAPDASKEPDVYLSARDPEGHHIGFVQLAPDVLAEFSKRQTARLIHAGFIVRDCAQEDSFYKDILGFHLYWYGGMKDDETNWISMQVPDGTDWVEYMLNVSPEADKHTIGVMNHIAICVSDIEAENYAVRKGGAAVHEDPKIGRDGKWQLNLYDPDDTRVEFVEFTPTQKPCCSEYTGPHPGQHP